MTKRQAERPSTEIVSSLQHRCSACGLVAVDRTEATDHFDVFIAYNSEHRNEVRLINYALRNRGICTWLDEEQMPAGTLHQEMIQNALRRVKASAVVLGRKGLGRWEAVELRTLIAESIDRNIPVIPVLLPGVDEPPQELAFLRQYVAVKFRKNVPEPEAIAALEKGIVRVLARDIAK
jgi:hypothetical protein